MSKSCKWKTIIDQCITLIFPGTCAACGKPAPSSHGLCEGCMAKVRYLSSPLCVRCGRDLCFAGGGDHICGDCLKKPPSFSMARSLCCYAPPVSILLQNLKYRADRTSLTALDRIVHGFELTSFATCDLIVPVPLYPKRLRGRGLNQSLLLARLLFPKKKGGIDPDSLIRIRDTVPQTGLDGKQRRQNLKAAFAVRRQEKLAGKRVCLVDDVYTTGTTLQECARTLKRSGAREVLAVTLARVKENP